MCRSVFWSSRSRSETTLYLCSFLLIQNELKHNSIYIKFPLLLFILLVFFSKIKFRTKCKAGIHNLTPCSWRYRNVIVKWKFKLKNIPSFLFVSVCYLYQFIYISFCLHILVSVFLFLSPETSPFLSDCLFLSFVYLSLLESSVIGILTFTTQSACVVFLMSFCQSIFTLSICLSSIFVFF